MAVFISGMRSDGKYIIDDGFVYKGDTTKNRNRYVKCSEEGCLASGVIRFEESKVTVLRPHCHPPHKDQEELALYRHNIRESAKNVSSMVGFRNIYDTESARFPVGSLQRGFSQDQQLMRRSRKTCFPPVPKDLDELHDILNFQPKWRNWALAHDSNEEFFRETIHANDGSRVSLFVSPYLSELLTVEGAEIAADATFDIRPAYPELEQFLCVHVWETVDDKRYSYPVSYALMETKSEAAYVAALEGMNSAVNNRMQPSTGMADFEKALHNAMNITFPGINTSGCWFHYCNATYQQARKCKLTDLCDVNQLANQILLKVMALPLLPPGEIANGLAIVEEQIEMNGFKNQFQTIIDNLKDYWLNDSFVGADILSVFELESRTNNPVELGHFLLAKKVGQVRPNLWVLIQSLKMHDYANHQDRQRVLSNVRTRRRRSATYVRQDHNISDMQSKLSEGSLTVEDFLARACHTVEGLQKRLKAHHE